MKDIKKKPGQKYAEIIVVGLFVFMSVAFMNQTVQALNQVAGNFGYRSGSYGFQGSATTSDALPSAPTAFLPSGITTNSAALSWVAPTTTTGGTAITTGGGNITGYKVHYGTNTLTTCTGGTQLTPIGVTTNLSDLTGGTTYYVAICATDNNNNDSLALTGNFTTGISGSVLIPSQSSSSGSSQPTIPPEPAEGSHISQVPQEKLELDVLSVRQLSNVSIVARTFSIDPGVIQKKIVEMEPVIKQEFQEKFNISLSGGIKIAFFTTIGAISAKNPELSTPRGMKGFLSDVVGIYGSQPFIDGQVDNVKAGIFTKLVASTAVGSPLDRREFDKDYKQLGITLLEREKEVVQSGNFQKFFGRNPGSNEDWKLIKIIAYRGRVLDRSISREVAARIRYEGVFNLKLKDLAESKKAQDEEMVAKAWSFIRATAASNLDIPK